MGTNAPAAEGPRDRQRNATINQGRSWPATALAIHLLIRRKCGRLQRAVTVVRLNYSLGHLLDAFRSIIRAEDFRLFVFHMIHLLSVLVYPAGDFVALSMDRMRLKFRDRVRVERGWAIEGWPELAHL